MKIRSVLMAAAVLGAAALAFGSGAKVSVGSSAPLFDATDSHGKSVKLDDYKGKYVVLEWCNFDCPYVQKHYGSGNMQALQKKYTQKGVVWLTIFSSAPGNSGYYSPSTLNKMATERKAAGTIVPDPSGTIGKMYGAKNTPTMFVIDPKGNVAYMGGIDNTPTPDPEDIKTSKNFVSLALDEALAGKSITTTTSRPYGCGIHNAN